MKNILDRELVESLNDSNNETFAKNLNETVYRIVDDALNDLCEKSPFIKKEKCVFLPVNEIYLGSFCQRSQYTYFLGVDNPQIAFNSKKRRNWWKYIWREFKASWRIGRKKKYKKNKSLEENKNKLEIEQDKYNINDFKHDMLHRIAMNVTETSVVSEYPTHLTVVGSDDFGFGVKVNIYICYYETKTDTFKIYKEKRNKFIDINFEKRFFNLNEKLEKCGKIFVDMAKLLNTIYSKTYDKIPNQIIVESLLYSCPDSLFCKDDIYKTFVNVVNYIRVVDPNKFVSICNEKIPMFNDKIITKSKCQADFNKIILMLDKYKY